MGTRLSPEKIRARMKRLCDRLYDARTSERVRRDLSMTISVLRARIGSLDIERLAAASVGAEECGAA